MKRLVYNKWYGGISNDPNAGQTGSVFNIQGIDVHHNSKYVRLSKDHNGLQLINTRPLGEIIASLYQSNTNYLELAKDGYLSGATANDANNGYVIKDQLGTGCNIGKITISNGNTYGFTIHSNNFSKWIYDTNGNVLGTYADLSTGINTDYSFDTTSGWTIGSNWTISGGKATHTSGSTAILSRSMSPDIGQEYRIYISSDVTAGSCVVKIGGETMFTISASTNGTKPVGFRTATSGTETLEFIPSTDFVGELYACPVQPFNMVSTSKTFNAKAPFVTYANKIFVGNGNKITEIDMSTGIAVITDTLVIDASYTIIGITRVADQFFIYGTDGGNSRQYIWNGVETAPTRVITWIDKPIQNVANFANIDYVIVGTGKRQQLCVVNGYQLQPIIVTDDYIQNYSRIYMDSTNINSIETIGNKILIGGDGGIYSFGNRTPGLPQALVKEYPYLGAKLTNIFYSESLGYSIFFHINGNPGGGSYYAYKGQIYLPDGEGTEIYQTVRLNASTGFIELQPITSETFSNYKHLAKYTLGCKLDANTQINTYIKDTYYANLYIPGGVSVLNFAIGDIYTYNGRTYTILDISKDNTYKGYILHCSYTGAELSGVVAGTYTKSSGSGPSTVYVERVRYGYRLIAKHTDTSKQRFSYAINGTYNEFQMAIELVSFYEKRTPKLYDFNLYYDEVIND